MIPEVAHIYGLFDPRISDVIWYVGKTNNARTRLQYYRKDDSTTPVYRWFRRLQSEGSEPQLHILETCPFSEWQERERALINLHRKKNLLLLNVFDGGNGTAVKGRKEFCECGEKRIILYPSDGTLRCPVCRKAQRKAYEKKWVIENASEYKQQRAAYYLANQDRIKKAVGDNKRKQIESGLCAQIGCKTVPTHYKKKCRFHLDMDSERMRFRRKDVTQTNSNHETGLY
jgi:hypothetical protein